MLAFELKKLWRKKTFLLMIVFSIALTLFVNYRSEYIILEEEYPQYETDQAALTLRIKFQELHMERMKQRKSVADMMPEKRQLSVYSKKKRGLLGKMSKPYYCGYSEEALGIEQIDLEEIEFLEKLQEKYQFPLSPSERRTWDWALFETKYAREHGVHTMTGCWQNHLSNAVRRILFNSRFLFGLPVILFFVFLFSGIVSREHETGTVQLLQMQPLSRLRILLAKFGAVWVSAVLYLVILCSVLVVSFLWLRLPMDGLGEIYRVLDGGEGIRYLTGAELLFRLFFSYLLLVTFFSSLLFLVSVGTSDSERVIFKVFSLLVVIWVFTENFSAFQHAWNPVYCMDYLRVLIGKIEVSMNTRGNMEYHVVLSSGIGRYALFGGVSFLFVLLSFWLQRVRSEKEVRNGSCRPISSVLQLELSKIMRKKLFFPVLMSGAVCLFCLFLPMCLRDRESVDFLTGDARVSDFRQERDDAKVELDRQSALTPNQGKVVDASGKEIRSADDEFLDFYRETLSVFEGVYADMQIIRDSYSKKDGKSYYEAMLHEADRSFGKISMFGGYIGYTAYFPKGQPTEASYHETVAIFQRAKEEGVSPVASDGKFFSAYEEFAHPGIKKRLEVYHSQKSHSAFYLPYRLLKEHHVDLAFLVIVVLMIFGGYVFDKENGEQLSLMYTEPVKRVRYHWTKIAVAVGLSVGLFLLFFAVVFLVGWISEGIGAWNFPVVNYLSLLRNPFGAIRAEVMKSISLLPMWQYLLRVFLVIVAECFFLSSLSTFLSIFVKEKNRLLAGLFLVVGGGVFLSNYLPQGILRLLSPFHYLQASTVANGAVKIFRHLPQESFWGSILILVVWGIILGILGAQIVKKRECV